MTKLSTIEGIGASYSARLEAAGIASVEAFLRAGSGKSGRKDISDHSGISEKLILNWINRADLARISGISTQYADLLEFAGVDTVPELAQRNGNNLFLKLKEINELRHLVRQVPSLSQVEDWVQQAQELPKLVTH